MAVFLLVRHGHNDMIGKKLAGRLPEMRKQNLIEDITVPFGLPFSV